MQRRVVGGPDGKGRAAARHVAANAQFGRKCWLAKRCAKPIRDYSRFSHGGEGGPAPRGMTSSGGAIIAPDAWKPCAANLRGGADGEVASVGACFAGQAGLWRQPGCVGVGGTQPAEHRLDAMASVNHRGHRV